LNFLAVLGIDDKVTVTQAAVVPECAILKTRKPRIGPLVCKRLTQPITKPIIEHGQKNVIFLENVGNLHN